MIIIIAPSVKSSESIQTKGKTVKCQYTLSPRVVNINHRTVVVVLVTTVMTMRIMKQGVGYASACAPRWMGPVGGLPRPARPIDDQMEEEEEGSRD